MPTLIVANRKKLLLSVALFCLPHAVFGMDQFDNQGIGGGGEKKYCQSPLSSKTLSQPTPQTSNPKKLSRLSLKLAAVPSFLQETPEDSFSVYEPGKQNLDDKETSPIETSKSKDQTASRTLNQRKNKRATVCGVPSFLLNSPQQNVLPELQKGRQNSTLRQDQSLTFPRSDSSRNATNPSSLQTTQQTILVQNSSFSKSLPKAQSGKPETVLSKDKSGFFDNLFGSKPEPKLDIPDLNQFISTRFNQIKNYPREKSLTPLESLALQFYIRRTEICNIRLVDLDPTLEFARRPIKPRELILFFDPTNGLYFEMEGQEKRIIVRSDNPTVFGYEADSFDRIMEALTPYNEKNIPQEIQRYRTAFQQNVQSPIEFLTHNLDQGPEILAAWDRERLFQYLSLEGYSLKEKGIKPWPSIKGEEITKMNPEEFLNKFWGIDKNWNYSFTKNLGMPDHLAKISDTILELIISSATFLTETIKNLKAEEELTGQEAGLLMNQLNQTLAYCYPELSRRYNTNEEYHYQSAKYLTEATSYEQAWIHINQCIPYLQNLSLDDETIERLKRLQANHLSNLLGVKKMLPHDQGNNYFEIASFAQTISILDNKNDRVKPRNGSQVVDLDAIDKPNLDAVSYYLEGLKNFYDPERDGFLFLGKIDEINKRSPDILFHVACKAYDIAKDDKKDADLLLHISQNCLLPLIAQKSQLSHNWEDIVETVSKSTYAPKTGEFSEQMMLRQSICEESAELIDLRAHINSTMGKILWNPDIKNEPVRSLFLTAAYLSYYAGYSIEKSTAKDTEWDEMMIESIIEGSIRFGCPVAGISLDSKIIDELCRILLEKQYSTEVYISAITHFKQREMWLKAFNLTQAATDFIPLSKKEEFDQLKQDIEQLYSKSQIQKNDLRPSSQNNDETMDGSSHEVKKLEEEIALEREKGKKILRPAILQLRNIMSIEQLQELFNLTKDQIEEILK